MPNTETAKFQKDLNGGLLGLAVLGALAAADADLYGYELAKRLGASGRAQGDPGAPFKAGSIYPVLRTLCAAGWLASRVVPSYAGPARRYYRITEPGRAILALWRKNWVDTRNFVDEILETGT